MTNEELEVFDKALYKFGVGKQIWVLIEECGELIDIIAKIQGNRATLDEIVSELADVSIMIEQAALYFGLEKFLEARKYKINKLKEKIQSYENC